MLIHQYDNHSGAYACSRLADEDPRNPGRWLVPAFCTTEPLPDRRSRTWPFYDNGKWVLRPDWRGQVLYRCDNGEPAEIVVAGAAPAEQGLTQTPRPSGKHVWTGDGWVLNRDAVAAEERARAMAQFERRLAHARMKNAGRADAFAAGLLSDEEAYYFKAWCGYQMALVREVEKPTFPEGVVWPDEPAPYVPPPPKSESDTAAALMGGDTADTPTDDDAADVVPAKPEQAPAA
ncbi:MAG TPA: tail fiber assembly protein [Trinickia sp.]|jgi:hypothetical protein|nr:tail fiber assembly protein [Trinickia sp.]